MIYALVVLLRVNLNDSINFSSFPCVVSSNRYTIYLSLIALLL